MAGIERKSFQSPDETRTPDKSTVAVVTVAGATAARKVLQPGWRWSESIKPIAGTEDCEFHHLGVGVSGRLHVEHRDGSAADLDRATSTSSSPATTRGSSATNPS